MAEGAARVVVRGRVQGVGFRAWTAREAVRLGLDGWVRNRADGTVEAAFFGLEEQVEEMVRRCGRGPWSARVEAVERQAEAGPAPEGFKQRPTA